MAECLRSDCRLHGVCAWEGEEYAPDPNGIDNLGLYRSLWDGVLLVANVDRRVDGPDRGEKLPAPSRRHVVHQTGRSNICA